jgi:hypothetical protein
MSRAPGGRLLSGKEMGAGLISTPQSVKTLGLTVPSFALTLAFSYFTKLDASLTLVYPLGLVVVAIAFIA